MSGSIFDFMSARFSELASSFLSVLKNVKLQMSDLVYPHAAFTTQPYIVPPPNQMPPDIVVRKTFSHFVEVTGTENEGEHPEYTSLRSEPTALMSTPQLALLHGRRVESHVVTTKDGYQLTAHRILPAPHIPPKYPNRTIILHHGLFGSSADWILLGPIKSLPYLLSDAGYDVWMANARGNYYSRGHTWKKVDTDEFWKFSWQEMGEFDLPAVIDYIRLIKNNTNSVYEKIDYIGHSMGATALLVLLSSSPLYNQYLRLGILIAPIAYMSNVEGPLKAMTSMASNPPKQLLKLIGTREFVPSRIIPKRIASKYCVGPHLFCCNPLYFITGGIPSTSSWNSSFVARVLYHVPAGASTDTILHYVQLVKSGKFHKFNDVYYEYNLNQITLPIALISSDEDAVATIPDVLRLYFSITNPVDHHIIRAKNFSHTDFVWSLAAPDLVFNKVFEYLENGLSWFTTKSDVHSNIIQ